MDVHKCQFCQNRIDSYGDHYFKIDLMKNYQSQGYPDEFAEKRIECCPNCFAKAFSFSVEEFKALSLKRSDAVGGFPQQ